MLSQICHTLWFEYLGSPFLHSTRSFVYACVVLFLFLFFHFFIFLFRWWGGAVFRWSHSTDLDSHKGVGFIPLWEFGVMLRDHLNIFRWVGEAEFEGIDGCDLKIESFAEINRQYSPYIGNERERIRCNRRYCSWN